MQSCQPGRKKLVGEDLRQREFVAAPPPSPRFCLSHLLLLCHDLASLLFQITSRVTSLREQSGDMAREEAVARKEVRDSNHPAELKRGLLVVNVRGVFW